MEICGDNRFEIIAKAKADLLEGTNIETDEAEMAVIDNILFRCWQMGWLDRYDRKTENSSEIPNNCETCEHYKLTCDLFSEICKYEPKDNSTISKMEQVEPQTKDYCDICNHKGCEYCISDSCNPYCVPSNYEPLTERSE